MAKTTKYRALKHIFGLEGGKQVRPDEIFKGLDKETEERLLECEAIELAEKDAELTEEADAEEADEEAPKTNLKK